MSGSSRTPARFVAGGLIVIGAVAAAAALPFTSAGEPAASTALAQSQAPEREVVRPVAELSEAFIAISEAVMPAIVRIESQYAAAAGARPDLPPELRDFFGNPDHEGMPRTSGGTGFIVRADGYIVTNTHVVQGADHIRVTLHDKHQYDAEVVGLDPTTDVALLRIDAENLPALRLGDSDAARVGEWVLAVGNPGFGAGTSTLDFTVTSGIISAKGRPLNILGDYIQLENGPAEYAIEDFIQTDAVINPGNSGGPLVNLRGEVIGINTAIASGTGFYQGYGFAVPMNIARRVVADLLEHGRVRRALLGVTIDDVTAEDAEVFGLPTIAGVLVQDFAAGSPAEQAGLERGDVIVSVDGESIDRVGHLQRLIAQYRPAERVDVGVVRYGTRVDLSVELMEAPLSAPMLPRPSLASRGNRDLGLRVTDVTRASASKTGLASAVGVVIEAVTPASPAARHGLRPGQRVVSIDRQPVTSAREARALLERTASGQVVSLLLSSPEGRTWIANIRVP
ncbi:MAG TPA: Do family serine endopeptidase [Longimicrobiales bacterium]|nr:Do family serine endopeptidase [Longimicrobiales bacterium]